MKFDSDTLKDISIKSLLYTSLFILFYSSAIIFIYFFSIFGWAKICMDGGSFIQLILEVFATAFFVSFVGISTYRYFWEG